MKKDRDFYIDNGRIFDKWGRVCLFRGINFGANSKTPSNPDGSTWRTDCLSETKQVTFTDKPFAEEDADIHFKHLTEIGCTLLRWNITWEAIEHDGPEQYDEDFLAYLRRILKKADDYGIHVFIDPHQDVWSRWTGGDGAPAWTLQMLGFKLDKLFATGAAFTQSQQGSDYKQMSWPLNYHRYACATMFTLFFAGNTFAPGILIDGIPVQDYLQEHYIAAMKHTARRLKDCDAIIGFGTLNEPHPGYIGITDLSAYPEPMGGAGEIMTPFEGMKASSGFEAILQPFSIGLTGVKKAATKKLPAVDGGVFENGYECPWKMCGVWHVDENGQPILDKPDYFNQINGKTVDFAADFLKPFQLRFIEELEAKHDHYLFFVEGTTQGQRSVWKLEEDEFSDKVVDAFHWYDGLTLLTKKWNPLISADSQERKPVFGKKQVTQSFVNQIDRTVSKTREEGIPSLLGEFGVPFDLNDGKSFLNDDYSSQEDALSAYYDALDELLMSATLWNYTPDNTHSHGDGWNGEDLSVYCADTKSLRAVKGFCRPYPVATAGIPQKMVFTRAKGDKKTVFEYEWNYVPPVNVDKENVDTSMYVTEIFVPTVWFGSNWHAELTDGKGVLKERPDLQRLFVTVEEPGHCAVKITE